MLFRERWESPAGPCRPPWRGRQRLRATQSGPVLSPQIDAINGAQTAGLARRCVAPDIPPATLCSGTGWRWLHRRLPFVRCRFKDLGLKRVLQKSIDRPLCHEKNAGNIGPKEWNSDVLASECRAPLLPIKLHATMRDLTTTNCHVTDVDGEQGAASRDLPSA